MTRRTVPLLLALLLAALATAALISYVRGVENRTLEGASPVSVFVAKDNIAAGTTAEAAIAQGLIERSSFPQTAVADDAVGSLEQIAGRVASATVFKGEQIVAGRFVVPSELTGVLPIPAGRQAMSVEVESPTGVGGFIQPGNRVSVLAKIDEQAAPGSRTSTTTTRVRFLLQDVTVLAVGQRIATIGGSRTDGGEEAEVSESRDRMMLTLALTPAQAEKLAFAVFEGDVYFTLLPKGQTATSTPGRTSANIFK